MVNDEGFSDMKDKKETRRDTMEEKYTTQPQHNLDFNDYDSYNELPEWAKKHVENDADIAKRTGTLQKWEDQSKT
jgi:hypothetical protein